MSTFLMADGRASCELAGYALEGEMTAVMGILISFSNAGGDGRVRGLTYEQSVLLCHVMTHAKLARLALAEVGARHAVDFASSITLLEQVIADPSLPSDLRFIFAFELSVLERRQAMIEGIRAERELSLSMSDQSGGAILDAA